MRTFALTTLAVSFVAVAFAANVAPASASPAEDYRQAMKPFANDLHAWTANLDSAVAAAVVKPEQACGEDMAELARIGGWMVADLAGMTAPTRISAAHDKLTTAVGAMTEAADTACGQAETALATIRAERDTFDTALVRIMNFVNGRYSSGRPGTMPDLPGSDG